MDLKVDNLDTGVNEEVIRQQFRAVQTQHVRPPHTYVYEPYSVERGYGFMLEEVVDAPVVFHADDHPEVAAKAFARFYSFLQEVLAKPFIARPDTTAKAFSEEQYDGWLSVATRSWSADFAARKALADKAFERSLALMEDTPLVFMHPHLSGSDVQVQNDSVYIVHANHFWGWRQPMYDLAFPVWGQWMALPRDKRGIGEVAKIANAWREVLRRELGESFDEQAWESQLLNRIYGSVLLDLPAIARRDGEDPASVQRLIEEFCAFGESL